MAGTPLTGATVSATYSGLLKTTDNGAVGGTQKVVTDGLGNDSALKVGNLGVSSTGTFEAVGILTAPRIVANAASGSLAVQLGAWDGLKYTGNELQLGSTAAGQWTEHAHYINGVKALSITETGLNSTAIGATTPSTGAFTTLTTSSAAVSGGAINNTAIGATTPSTGAFTTLSATGATTLPLATTLAGYTRVASDFTKVSDTTPAAITGLSVTLAAGQTYSFDAMLYVSQLSGPGGYNVALGGTATATSCRGNIVITYGTGTVSQSSITSITSGSSFSVGGGGQIHIHGTVTADAGGTFLINFCQATATGSSTVLRGSYLHVTQYP